MGGDNFKKTDDINGFVPFAPVAIKQTQMNAEHALWLQENHIIESNIEILTSIAKEIAKAASQGLSKVCFHISSTYLNSHPLLWEHLRKLLTNNGFHLKLETTHIKPELVDEVSNLFGNWEIEGKIGPSPGIVLIKKLMITW